MKPTKDQIAAEIAALKKLKPIGPFARKTAETIQVQIDALSGEVDETADEWNDLTEEHQMNAMDCINWLNGDTETQPSKDWGGLVEP